MESGVEGIAGLEQRLQGQSQTKKLMMIIDATMEIVRNAISCNEEELRALSVNPLANIPPEIIASVPEANIQDFSKFVLSSQQRAILSKRCDLQGLEQCMKIVHLDINIAKQEFKRISMTMNDNKPPSLKSYTDEIAHLLKNIHALESEYSFNVQERQMMSRVIELYQENLGKEAPLEWKLQNSVSLKEELTVTYRGLLQLHLTTADIFLKNEQFLGEFFTDPNLKKSLQDYVANNQQYVLDINATSSEKKCLVM